MSFENKNGTDWLAKERREQFCKSSNSQIINGKKELDEILQTAQTIVDKAWELYPSGNENNVEIPT